MKVIQTVCGPVPEQELGVTLMHEHCLATNGGPGYAYIPEMLCEYFLFEGVTKAQMDKLLLHSPRAILTMGADEG